MNVMNEEKQLTNQGDQTTAFKSGNDMAALAAAQINYHLMGYFPITPSTEIAQLLDISRSYVSRVEKHAIELLRDAVGGVL